MDNAVLQRFCTNGRMISEDYCIAMTPILKQPFRLTAAKPTAMENHQKAKSLKIN